MTPREVRDMELRLSQPDMTMDVDADDEETPRSPLAYLPAPGTDPAPQLEAQNYHQVRATQLHEALAQLDERSKSILKKRWFSEPKRTLQELSEEYGVSGERIRQIEVAAMKKMRATLV